MKSFNGMSEKDLEMVKGSSGTPLFYGANGYLNRDIKGHYKHIVTQVAMEAVIGVMVNRWASNAG